MIHFYPGTKLILLYMFIAYIVPAILVDFAGFPWIYKETPVNWEALAILLLALSVYIILGNVSFSGAVYRKEKVRYCLILRFPGDSFQITFLLLLVVISGIGVTFGFSDFRYSSTGISGSGSVMLILFALVPTFLQFFLLVYLFYMPNAITNQRDVALVKKILLALGLVLSSNGIATLCIAVLGILNVVCPKILANFLFLEVRSSGRRVPNYFFNKLNKLLVILIFFLLASVAWIAGEAIKRNELTSVIDLIFSSALQEFAIEWLVMRLSPSYISLVTALDYYALATEWSVISNHLFAPVESFFFRLNLLLMNPFDFPKSLAGTIARINYLLITVDEFIRDREGTSPGLIAGFLFSFPFPLNFMVLISYLLILQNFATRMINGVGRQMSLVGWCVFLVFMLPMFASPIDFLLIIDDGIISALLLFLLAYVCLQKKVIKN
jgi:hypothetical protein